MRNCNSKFQTTFALLCVCLWQGLSATVRAQDEPPVLYELFKCCVGVKCIGSDSFAIIPGYGKTPDLACADAKLNAFAHCGGQDKVDTIRKTKIEIALCDIAEFGSGNFLAKATAQTEVWRVKGKLCYCDGSDGFELTTSGPTRCAAIKLVHDRLCAAKDPCKRACVTVWVIESPTSNCQPMMNCR